AYFEVEVTRTTGAYDQTRKYHITANDGSTTISTPVPRQLYVEHLISQGRNGSTDIKVSGPDPGLGCGAGTTLTSVAAGGTLALLNGHTYCIEMDTFTATQGYDQLESFLTLSNTIFQILSVNTTYSVVNSSTVTTPLTLLYANACNWVTNPLSPAY